MIFSNKQLQHIEEACGKEAANKLRDERMKLIQDSTLMTFYHVQDVIQSDAGFVVFDCIEKRPAKGKVECERVFIVPGTNLAYDSFEKLMMNFYNQRMVHLFNQCKEKGNE